MFLVSVVIITLVKGAFSHQHALDWISVDMIDTEKKYVMAPVHLCSCIMRLTLCCVALFSLNQNKREVYSCSDDRDVAIIVLVSSR